MSSAGGADDTQRPLSENPEYGPDEQASSQAAARLLRPRRSFVRPVITFGILALLVAIGVSRLGPLDQPKPQPQTEVPVRTPPEKQHIDSSNELKSSLDDPSPEQPSKPAEPFKSLVLDAAQSYLATGSLPVAPMPAAKSGNTQKAM
jgi:hypothetical protein